MKRKILFVVLCPTAVEASLFKLALCSFSLVNTTHLELDAMATASKSGEAWASDSNTV